LHTEVAGSITSKLTAILVSDNTNAKKLSHLLLNEACASGVSYFIVSLCHSIHKCKEIVPPSSSMSLALSIRTVFENLACFFQFEPEKPQG
jgi:hypothetical protein